MTPLERLADAVDELTRPHTHREPLLPDMAPISARTGKTLHGAVISEVLSLLDQLERSTMPGSGPDPVFGHAAPGSMPAASMEALDALNAIDREARRTLAYIGGRPRAALDHTLRALIGASSLRGDQVQRDVAQEADRWVSRAKSVTGWETAPFKPDNTCPLCERRHSLRIRTLTATDVHASCVGCGEVWTPQTIGLLIAHIRWENREVVICERELNVILANASRAVA